MSYTSTKLIPGLIVTLSETPEIVEPYILVWDTHLNEINRVHNKPQIRSRAEVRHLQANWWNSKSQYRNKTQLRYLCIDVNPKTRFPKNFKSILTTLSAVRSVQHLSLPEHRRTSDALRMRHPSQEPLDLTEPKREVLLVLSYGYINSALRFSVQQHTCSFEHTLLLNYDHMELNAKEFPTTDTLLADAAKSAASDYLSFFNACTDALLLEIAGKPKRTRAKHQTQEAMEI